jgi:regulator of protease activity HflC (stomatin/prohibitin superfamily)
MERDVEISPMPLAATVVNAICFVPNICCGWQTVNQRQVVVTEYCSQVTGVRDTPGCYRQPCCGSSTKIVSTAVQTLDLPNSKVVDSNGSPIMVSAIVNYQVERPLAAIYDVANYQTYVLINAQAAVKGVIGGYTYNELKSKIDLVNEQLSTEMQPKVDVAGVKVLSVALNELNYAPEIASAMLKKQSAGAMLEARELIVQGAVKIATDAIAKLEQGGMQMTNDDKVKIVTNLLTVTCSDSDAQPTISV